MQRKLLIMLVILCLSACNSDSLLSFPSVPTPTATFMLAVFSTPTPTSAAGHTAVTDSVQSATSTPTANPTSTPTEESRTEPTTIAEADDELEASSFDSPISTPTPEATAAIEPVTEATATEAAATEATPTEAAATAAATTPPPSPNPEPTPTALPTPAPPSGRIAFPVDDGGGHYDVWVFEPPDGDPFIVQPRARQPNFSTDGRLLVNNQDNQLGEGLGLLDVNYSWLGLVTDTPEDASPFWHPDGSRYAYANANALIDPVTGDPLPHVLSPCSMRVPRFEDTNKCRDILTHGKIAVGEAPVWTDDDRIAFLSFAGDDGIYVVGGASSLWQSGSVGEPQFLVSANGRPTDTDGFQVFFSAGNIDQNWEAYAVDLDGSNLVNLSQSDSSQDGLPTVSPDGNWIAFVSDRDGQWGIWAVPRAGGEPVKLLDLSTLNTKPNPWGVGDRAWMTERISWGP